MRGSGVKNAKLHDLRAKSATDIEREHGMEHAQKLLGHAHAGMTRRYLRERRTTRVAGPTKAA